MERNVAVAYPKTPTNIVGTSRDLHPLAAAMPAPVVGPPTLAFEARSNSLRSKDMRRPIPRMRARCTAIWMKENRNRDGALLATCATLPAAPTAAKKTCTKR